MKTVFFSFADPEGFSGQKEAAELVFDGLKSRGWKCVRLPLPVYERGVRNRLSIFSYLSALARAWLRAFSMVFARGAWLWVGLGQTRASFLRDAFPVLLGAMCLGRKRVVISLNGAVFMGWPAQSLNAKMFRFLINRAGVVTVVGERQQARLIELGIHPECVRVVVNTCRLDAIECDAILRKHRDVGGQENALRCLHLSSLIDTKGFPEYLGAMRLVSQAPGVPVQAELCGRVVVSEFSERFQNAAAATAWIEECADEINRLPRVRLHWTKGATGAAKAELFNLAHIFVLPTRYAVEAQPLVLLEAMAAGCAIITTKVGEIPTILDEDSALLLEDATPEAVYESVTALIEDRERRIRIALAARNRFVTHYALDRHLDKWERLLASMGREGVAS